MTEATKRYTLRQRKVMDLLSSGQPVNPTDLRRGSGLGVNALHRVLIQLSEAERIHVVLVDGKQWYAKSTEPLPTLATAWARTASKEGVSHEL